MDGNSKANQMLLSKNQDESRDLAAKLALLDTRFAQSQGQRAALEALYNDLSVSRDETALAEVEQLLLIAGQQLQLSANVKAALIALQTADARLQRMGRPALNGLRKSIAKDMDRLRVLPVVDVAALNAQLDNMIAAVDDMSFPYQQHKLAEVQQPAAVTGSESAWQRLLREIWQEAKQLVRIENTGKAEVPLLPPSQEFFLRENLKLHLLMARLDLLSRDEAGFKQEIRTAQQWVTRYFDTKSNTTIRQLEGLRKLAVASINIELPDISPSLNMVRNHRLARENEPRASSEARPKVAR
jgi:uroporphyrin-3 C-methyltransferase